MGARGKDKFFFLGVTINSLLSNRFFGEAFSPRQIIPLPFTAYFYGQQSEKRRGNKKELLDPFEKIVTAHDRRQSMKKWAMESACIVEI